MKTKLIILSAMLGVGSFYQCLQRNTRGKS